MPYCPDCGTEYRPGFFECADCRVALTDSAPEASAPPARRKPPLALIVGLCVAVAVLLGLWLRGRGSPEPAVGDPKEAVIRRYGKPRQWMINQVNDTQTGGLAVLDSQHLPDSRFTAPQPRDETWDWVYGDGKRFIVVDGHVQSISSAAARS